MSDSRNSGSRNTAVLTAATILSAAACALSVAWCLAWTTGMVAGIESSVARGGILLAWTAVVGLAMGLIARRLRRDIRTARRALELLCRSVEEHGRLTSNSALLALSPNHPWHDTIERVRRSLEVSGEQAELAEQSRAAAEIRAQRNSEQCRRMSAVLSSLSDPVLVLDHYDDLVMTNASAEKLLQISGEDAGKRALSNISHCEELISLLADTRRRKVASSRNDEIELSDPEGRARWFSVTTSPIAPERDLAEGRTGGNALLAVMRDITAQKSLQKRNAEYLSAVSHEMKTPLAGIKAYVELLADGDAEDDETREEFLRVINSQADRLRRLIDNMLNMSRIESGVVQVNKQICSLNELLSEALEIMRPSAEEKNIDLAAELSPMYLGVLVDRDQMLQTAINLLSNGIKYTNRGGRVTLHSRLVDKQVQFDVEDTGVGLNEEDQLKVFEKFYRVQKDKDMAQGTGLGLPLAKYIVQDVHGGRLTLDSAPGVGSTFTVTLPSAGQMT